MAICSMYIIWTMFWKKYIKAYEKCKYYLNYVLKKVYQSMSTKNIKTAQKTKLHLIRGNMSNMIKQAFFRWHQTKATVRS
jgi:hypothetical protein